MPTWPAVPRGPERLSASAPPAVPRAPTPTLIVTRPAEQAAAWLQALAARGIDARALPLIDIVAVDDLAPLRRVWERLPEQALVMFVSANAVRHFFAARPNGCRWPPTLQAGCTGPGTQAALVAAGVPLPAIVAPAPDDAQESESLWKRLAHDDWHGRSVTIVRGEDGRDWLADRLREAGADVDFVTAYGRRPPRPDAAGLALLQATQQDPAAWCWHFSSSQAVAHLSDLAPEASWAACQALTTHPRIARAAQDAGFGRVALIAPGLQAAMQALASSASDRPNLDRQDGAGKDAGAHGAHAKSTDAPGAAPTISG